MPTDIDSLYQSYSSDPTPDNLFNVVDALSPTINYSLSAINASGDKLLRTKARNIAAQAVQKYDPTAGANLQTWTSNQLMQLRRIKRETQTPVKIPERTQLEAYSLARAEQEFYDKYNREPDLIELADYSKIPKKKIEKIRRTFRKIPEQGALEDMTAQTTTDWTSEALDYIYRDADAIDRKILEMKTGYGGKYEPMEPKDIAIQLSLTPSQLSRRSAKIALQIQDIESALMEVHGQ